MRTIEIHFMNGEVKEIDNVVQVLTGNTWENGGMRYNPIPYVTYVTDKGENYVVPYENVAYMRDTDSEITTIMRYAKIAVTESRYGNFHLLDRPISFNSFVNDTFPCEDFDIVQLHSLEPCGENHIVGFCGSFSLKKGRIIPLDGDSYDAKMLIYGYKTFSKDGKIGMDILVGNDW